MDLQIENLHTVCACQVGWGTVGHELLPNISLFVSHFGLRHIFSAPDRFEIFREILDTPLGPNGRGKLFEDWRKIAQKREHYENSLFMALVLGLIQFSFTTLFNLKNQYTWKTVEKLLKS